MVDFFDTLSVRNAEQILAEIEVTEHSGLFGLHVRHILERSPNVTVLGLQRASGELVVGPRPDQRLESGDRIMVVGPENDVSDIARDSVVAVPAAERM